MLSNLVLPLIVFRFLVVRITFACRTLVGCFMVIGVCCGTLGLRGNFNRVLALIIICVLLYALHAPVHLPFHRLSGFVGCAPLVG